VDCKLCEIEISKICSVEPSNPSRCKVCNNTIQRPPIRRAIHAGIKVVDNQWVHVFILKDKFTCPHCNALWDTIYLPCKNGGYWLNLTHLIRRKET